MKRFSKIDLFITMILLFTISGCRTAFFHQLDTNIDHKAGFVEIRRDPSRHKGEKVLLGGEVLRLRYQEWKTEVEFSEIPLKHGMHPSLGHPPGERFFVVFPERLDRFLYRKGKVMTISGRVIGTRTMEGNNFPLLENEEAHVWNRLRQDRFPSFGVFIGQF